MDTLTVVATVLGCLFGSGGIVIWVLNRMARKHDANDSTAKDLIEIKAFMQLLLKGLIMCLENDCVIFNALKTHQINGDSEKQEKKMNDFFLSLLKEKNK